MKYEMVFCSMCNRKTTHIEEECINCSFRENAELEEKLEMDAEALEQARVDSRRKPK